MTQITSIQAISVVIPVYNEAGNIAVLTEEIIDKLSNKQFDYELIYIDDGSSDNTLFVLYELKQKFPWIKIIAHKKNYGQSAALCTGVRQSTNPIVVTLDGDGQNDPSDIAALCSFVTDSKTIILGTRVNRKDTFWRKIVSKIGNRIRNLVLHDGCPDSGCSLKVFPREAFMELPKFNHMHRFLPALFLQKGYKLINVPVNHRGRLSGVSKYGTLERFFAGIYDLIGVTWLSRRSFLVECKNENE
ncbi:glycosyltransferase family 2 protein [Legionella pneumophila]|uniref:glycosyltransferase family 2 protein n=1 Tax=Legionella pneumophila TaxID=446 RepID=UPI00030762D7|nr:glycosyltransferase family 2 protein [Legionella pneumophila]MCK1858075.1 glycosyltransferase family 2 protein [Legionella pneumophila]MDW9140003.1 glycosyltransferase family 2 protein [Legionella pneumophila]MDW9164771.1 glycosyltransferase family 2 protein [Legionella pneumophila]CZI64597.1 Undecaprenyl-phosphate 4-deoxy-4-formamido-L-arabinose transferase [Legionella pneumophila]CZQ81667.1 Undecaprenyl-phosphate 4-deoxy-4-formamido-L-arabinose transferase [Legionella pneumophila]